MTACSCMTDMIFLQSSLVTCESGQQEDTFDLAFYLCAAGVVNAFWQLYMYILFLCEVNH
jgi:hypothetical protein